MFIAIAALALALATALGAWAAHGLEQILVPSSVETFRTGVEYHFYHGLGLLGIGLLVERSPENRFYRIAAWLIIFGILMFSGSLYVLAFGNAAFLGPLTPLGGLALIAAWICLAAGALRKS